MLDYTVCYLENLETHLFTFSSHQILVNKQFLTLYMCFMNLLFETVSKDGRHSKGIHL